MIEQADVVGHGACRVDVVGDDQERGLDLGVEIDDQLVEIGGANRVEARVRLIEEDDLGVEDQGSGQSGALAHPTGDLARQLGLGTLESDQLDLLADDRPDRGLGLLRVLAQGEGDVVVEAHGPEQRAVLEQHPEQLAYLVEVVLAQPGQVPVVDPDRALLRLEQPHQRLQKHGLAGAGRAEHDRDLPGWQRQGHVAPDHLGPERLGQSLNPYLNAHCFTSLGFVARSIAVIDFIENEP